MCRKAYPFGEDAQICSGHNQLVLCPNGIGLEAAAAVGKRTHTLGPALRVDRAGNAKPQQHPLHRTQRCQAALGQPYADAFLLTALHASVGVEQAPKERRMKDARAPFNLRRQVLGAGAQSVLKRQPLQCSQRKPQLALSGNINPPDEIGPARQAPSGIESRPHHPGDSRPLVVSVHT